LTPTGSCPRGYWTTMSFMEIFQPGLKHLREEQYRRQMDIAYPTNGGNPPIDIDLDAGTATIVVRLPAEHLEETADQPDTDEPNPSELNSGDLDPDEAASGAGERSAPSGA
jgi:hypothetical protein